MVVDETLIETFERDGAVTVRGLIDDAWIASLRAAVDEMLERAYDPRARLGSRRAVEKPESVMSDGMWRDNDAFRTFLFESRIGEAAAKMMRSQSARLFEDLLLYGAAGSDGAASWHQDEPGWPVSGRQLASVWFTLDGASSDTGALRIVAGSHRGPMYRPRVSSKRADTIGDDWQHWSEEPLPDVEAAPDDYPIRVYETEPGDAVVFHPRALHTGKGSSPDRPRRTFTIRMLGDDIRWQPRSVLFHPWMAECGFEAGDVLDHPGFPVVWSAAD